MKLKNITIALLLFAYASIGHAQSQKNLSGFQDIPWGSSIQTVRAKFPDLKPHNACLKSSKEEQKAVTEFFQSQDIDCTSYGKNAYVIDGMNFHLKFEFTSALQLKGVTLERLNRDNSDISLSECSAGFTKLSDLLSSKYGQGYPVPSNTDPKGYKSLGFTNHEAKFWALGSTELYLAQSWGHYKMPYYCWLILSYSPGKNSSASKL